LLLKRIDEGISPCPAQDMISLRGNQD